MIKQSPNEQKLGFPVSKDKLKSSDLKPTNVNPPTPKKIPDQNQKKP